MKKMGHQEVEIQITPMLDMAFQLLTFFIMTFNPAPAEGQFTMNLLPAAPQAKLDAPAEAVDAPADPSVPASLKSMTVSLYTQPNGTLGRVVVGENEVQGMEELRAKLKEILGDKSNPFEQVVIQGAADLTWEELIRVVDVFTSLDITKISFSELDATGAGGLP
jgi:biopolymer transport protein ExbD